jgi:hypothetical protein
MPSGIISLRVAPDDLKRLLGSFEKLGKIVQHATERQDKTTVVVDTEAKIKNLTSFRDNLRAMLSKSAATVKDLVEIQKQLTDTQSELDSETAQRKILANETEKIAAEISLRVERPSGNAGGGFAHIWNALRESGSILADSTASLITTIVAIIPWRQYGCDQPVRVFEDRAHCCSRLPQSGRKLRPDSGFPWVLVNAVTVQVKSLDSADVRLCVHLNACRTFATFADH